MEVYRESLQQHPIYRDVQVYHKFHALKERQQAGVVLRSASATRIKTAPDDFLGTLDSHCTLARVGSAPGTSMEWVWEDQEHITYYQTEDVTASLNRMRTVVKVSRGSIVAGHSNTIPADNHGQITLRIDGALSMARDVNGKTGEITLWQPLPAGSTVTVSYYSSNIDIPGYYFLELTSDSEFVCTPLHRVKDEVVIATTTGTEMSANLAHGPVVLSSPFYLYTKKQSNSHKLTLDAGTDFNLAADGTITFLLPLRKDTTLYATYGWQGEDRGPFSIQGEDTYVSDAIRGVTLAFGTRKVAGDKQVVVLAPQRETMAQVFGGHFTMQLELMVYARDPLALSEMVDHLVSDIWGNRRQVLTREGLTIDELDPAGESEEMYDDNAQIQYFQHSISMTMITEWKKFVPYMVNVRGFNVNLSRFVGTESAPLRPLSQDYTVLPETRPFEVTYPQTGYPRYH